MFVSFKILYRCGDIVISMDTFVTSRIIILIIMQRDSFNKVSDGRHDKYGNLISHAIITLPELMNADRSIENYEPCEIAVTYDAILS